MAILKNIRLANSNLVTAFGKFHFSEDGTVEVDDAVAEKLATLNGYSIVDGEEKDDKEGNKDDDGKVGNNDGDGHQDGSDNGNPDGDGSTDGGNNGNPDDGNGNSNEEEITREELEELTVKQLEKYAKENEIDLKGATKKADIISAILGE